MHQPNGRRAMLPTDVDLVNLCAQIYASPNGWDYYDSGPDDQVVWALKKLDGCDVVVFRGSITAHDWWEDARAVPLKTRIGTVHEGFYSGMEHMWSDVAPMLTQPVMVTGHSLGAARADILTGLMVADGKPPIRRAVFGEPRPGLADFAAFLKDVPGHGFRNSDVHGHDLVTDVPLRLAGEFDFVHPSELVYVTASPTAVERLDPMFCYHHIPLYQKAMLAYAKEVA